MVFIPIPSLAIDRPGDGGIEQLVLVLASFNLVGQNGVYDVNYPYCKCKFRMFNGIINIM